MFYEILTSKNKEWLLYNVKAKRVAIIPKDQQQLFQTLKFRLIISLALYSLLSMFKELSPQFCLLLSAFFIIGTTYYYYSRAIPQLKWHPLNDAKIEHQATITTQFTTRLLTIRMSVLFILSAIVGIAFFFQAGSLLSLEKLLIAFLAMTLFIEACRSLLALKFAFKES